MAEFRKIELIVVEQRFRKFFDSGAEGELAESIQRIGLLNAVVVRGDVLIAGERRLRAIKTLALLDTAIMYGGQEVPLHHVPVVDLTFLSERQAREAEFDENVRRMNFTWQEHDSALAALHQLRISENPEHTQADTAKELGISQTTVSNALQGAALLEDGELTGTKTREEAVKLARKKGHAAQLKQLAEEFSTTATPAEEQIKIILGDVFEEMPKLADGTAAVVISDPPYGIDAQDFKNMGADKHVYDDSVEASDKIIAFILEQSFRVTKPDAAIFMFCDPDRFATVRELMRKFGWTPHRTPLIWYKGTNAGTVPWPTSGPRRSYEFIAYAKKGSLRWHGVRADTFLVPHDREIQRGAHKPGDLYKELLATCAAPGDLVIDPTAGSGPLVPAARVLQLHAVLIEQDPAAVGLCHQRMQEDTEGSPLDDF